MPKGPSENPDSLMSAVAQIAVLGASGSVGKAVLQSLCDAGVPVSQIVAIHSGRRSQARVTYGEEADIGCVTLDKVDFGRVSTIINCLSEGKTVIAKPYLARFSGRILDTSGYFSLDPNVPLLVPYVSEEKEWQTKKITAVANPLVSGVVHALRYLNKTHTLTSITLSSYEGVSVEGHKGMAELMQQTKDALMNAPSPVVHFPKTMAFNTLPCVGNLHRAGAETSLEELVRLQLCKFYKRQIPIDITRVLVPAFVGVGISLHVTFAEPLTKSILGAARTQGVCVVAGHDSAHADFATHMDVAGDDFIYVGRRRMNPNYPNRLQLWVALDNLRWSGAMAVASFVGKHNQETPR